MNKKKTPMQLLNEKYSQQQTLNEKTNNWHSLEEIISVGKQVAKETAMKIKLNEL